MICVHTVTTHGLTLSLECLRRFSVLCRAWLTARSFSVWQFQLLLVVQSVVHLTFHVLFLLAEGWEA